MSSVPYYLADADGRIVATGRCHERVLEQQSRGGATAYPGQASAGQYRDDAGEVRDRAPWQFPDAATFPADGVTVLVLANIPARSHCTLTGPIAPRTWTEDGGAIEITTNLPGTYTLRIDPPRHQPRTCVITAA